MSEETPLHDLTREAGAVLKEFTFPFALNPSHGGSGFSGPVPENHSGSDRSWLVPVHFGSSEREYQQVCQDAGLFDLSYRGKLELSGPDAVPFLNNLCSNDVKNLPVGGGCEAFLTTNKAKVVSHLRIFHLQAGDGRQALWLDLEPGQSEPVIQHLDRYVISEQVEFSDRSRDFALLHLAGPNARIILEKALDDEVPNLEELQHMIRTFGRNATVNIRKHSPLGFPGYDIICLMDRVSTIWHQLTQSGAKLAGHQTYEILRIEAGTPVFGIDFDVNTFAPEVGRNRQAISYNKGCYLGQEPIVMARDRGQINRQLMGLKLEGNPVFHGNKLYSGEKEAGWVTSSVHSPGLGTTIAMGMVRRSYWDLGTQLEVESEGQRRPVVVTAIPFTG